MDFRTILLLSTIAFLGCSGTTEPRNPIPRGDSGLPLGAGGGGGNSSGAGGTGGGQGGAGGSSIDCSTAGCAAPPSCSTGCTDVCGCCPCSEGQRQGNTVCRGGCYAPLPDAGP